MYPCHAPLGAGLPPGCGLSDFQGDCGWLRRPKAPFIRNAVCLVGVSFNRADLFRKVREKEWPRGGWFSGFRKGAPPAR